MKFIILDKVIIQRGFYSGYTGVIKSRWGFQYLVYLDKTDNNFIPERLWINRWNLTRLANPNNKGEEE